LIKEKEIIKWQSEELVDRELPEDQQPEEQQEEHQEEQHAGAGGNPVNKGR